MNRKTKINLLKSLQKGMAALVDLVPKRFKIVIGIKGSDRPGTYINDKKVRPEEFWEASSRQMSNDKAKIKVTRV